MFPKNIAYTQLTDLTKLAALTEEVLETAKYTPIGQTAALSFGFDFVRDDQRQFVYHNHMLLHMKVEKKTVPASAIKSEVKTRSAELEKRQGHKPGRTQLKDLKAEVKEALLMRAIPTTKVVPVFIDMQTGIVAIDSSSSTVFDQVIGLLYAAAEIATRSLPAWPEPETVTRWMAGEEDDDDYLPDGLTLDDKLVLEHPGEEGKTVAYKHTNMSDEDVMANFALGAVVKAVAMTWDSKVSFVWKDNGTLASVKSLDTKKEPEEGVDKFQNDFFLAADTVRQLTSYMIRCA